MTRIEDLPDILAPVFSDLRSLAHENDKELDDSFFIELINYSRRVGISELPPDNLKKLAEEFGREAIMAPTPEKRLGAIAAREAIVRECNRSMRGCNMAAEAVLGEDAMQRATMAVDALSERLNRGREQNRM